MNGERTGRSGRRESSGAGARRPRREEGDGARPQRARWHGRGPSVWLGLYLVSALTAVGCATTDERVVALPRVPAHPLVPHFPPALEGLRFRVRPFIEGAAPGDETWRRVEHACVANIEGWLTTAGWKVAPDPGPPANLEIEEHCTTGLRTERRGALVEMRRPPDQVVAVVVWHAGAPILTVSRGPSDYACEPIHRDAADSECRERAELWAQARVIDALSRSPEVAAVAESRGRQGPRAGGQAP